MGIISDLKTNDDYVVIAADVGSFEPIIGKAAESFQEDPDNCFITILVDFRQHVAEAVAGRHPEFRPVSKFINDNILPDDPWEGLMREFEKMGTYYQKPEFRADHSYMALVASYVCSIFHLSEDPRTIAMINGILDQLDKLDGMYGLWENSLVATALWFADRDNFQGRVMAKYPEIRAERRETIRKMYGE